MNPDIQIREVTLDDAVTVAQQRAAMFLEMGQATRGIMPALRSQTLEYLQQAIPRRDYVGWLACLEDEPSRVVAGAGAQVRRVLPFPARRPDGSTRVAWGAQAMIINVYTQPAYRRRGIARRLIEEAIAWAHAVEMESLVLHATAHGASLYELGFMDTAEMVYGGDLSHY